MKTESNIKPDLVAIETHGDVTDVVLTENVTEITRDESTIYQYDKYRLTVRNRPNLQTSVEANLASWLQMAKEKEDAPKEQTIPERVATTENKVVTIEETIDVIFGGV